MPSPDRIVINTGPLIALVAGLGSLELLRDMYKEVIVPAEVALEIGALKTSQFVQPEFEAGRSWLAVVASPVHLPSWLRSSLDPGEASVIQTAEDKKISTVVIDEAAGRRVASLCGLKVTGSVGILLRAKAEGRLPSVKHVLNAMKSNGVWLGSQVLRQALRLAGEPEE